MIETLGRFIKRGRSGDGDLMAVMSLTKEGAKFFKEDVIYTIKSIQGELLIDTVGKTHMDPWHWGSEIGEVITCYRPLLTQKELDLYYSKKESE